MAKTLFEALAGAGLVSESSAVQEANKRRQRLAATEQLSESLARSRGWSDEEKATEERRFHNKAAREGRQQTSNSGSQQYLNRFMK